MTAYRERMEAGDYDAPEGETPEPASEPEAEPEAEPASDDEEESEADTTSEDVEGLAPPQRVAVRKPKARTRSSGRTTRARAGA